MGACVAKPAKAKKQFQKDALAIVGAGLIGLYLALSLANDGYKVDVFEKRKDVFTSRGRRSALVLNYRALVGLHSVGIKVNEIKEFSKINGVGMYKDSIKPLMVDFTGDIFCIDRQVLYEIMVEKCK